MPPLRELRTTAIAQLIKYIFLKSAIFFGLAFSHSSMRLRIFLCLCYFYSLYCEIVHHYNIYNLLYNIYNMHNLYMVLYITIAKTCKQPRCPPVEEWIKTLWCPDLCGSVGWASSHKAKQPLPVSLFSHLSFSY